MSGGVQKGVKKLGTGLWSFTGQIRMKSKEWFPSTRVIGVDLLVAGTHVVPRWETLSKKSQSQWKLFNTLGTKVHLKHFTSTGMWDLVEDTGM